MCSKYLFSYYFKISRFLSNLTGQKSTLAKCHFLRSIKAGMELGNVDSVPYWHLPWVGICGIAQQKLVMVSLVMDDCMTVIYWLMNLFLTIVSLVFVSTLQWKMVHTIRSIGFFVISSPKDHSIYLYLRLKNINRFMVLCGAVVL